MVVKSPWPAPEIPDMDVTAFVLRHAQRLADAPALIDGTSGRTLTYGELAAAVDRVAGGLAARGVARGDVIALHLPNLPEFPIALHGALRAGAVVTTVSPLFTARELGDQMRRSRARLLVTAGGPLAATAREAAGAAEVLELGELLALAGAPPARPARPGRRRGPAAVERHDRPPEARRADPPGAGRQPRPDGAPVPRLRGRPAARAGAVLPQHGPAVRAAPRARRRRGDRRPRALRPRGRRSAPCRSTASTRRSSRRRCWPRS